MKSEKPALKLWLLEPRDPMEPPFHFHGVPAKIIVAAENAVAARNLAASQPGWDAWKDAMATCHELQPKVAGVIAAS